MINSYGWLWLVASSCSRTLMPRLLRFRQFGRLPHSSQTSFQVKGVDGEMQAKFSFILIIHILSLKQSLQNSQQKLRVMSKFVQITGLVSRAFEIERNLQVYLEESLKNTPPAILEFFGLAGLWFCPKADKPA